MYRYGKVVWIPFFGFVVALALLVGVVVFQRSFIYLSGGPPGSPESRGVPEFSVVDYSTTDGINLFGWFVEPKGNKPVLLYLHGNRRHLGLYAPKMRPIFEAGYGILMAEYRGYGGNAGRPSETGLVTDARAAYDYLLNLGIKKDRIVFYGESLGSAVAVGLASEVRPAGLILESPFTSAVDVARAYWPHLPVELIIMDRFDTLNRIHDLSVPLLLFHGEKDKVFPVHLGRRLFQAANEPKRGEFFENGAHENLHEHGGTELVLEWLGSLDATRVVKEKPDQQAE